MQHVIAAVAAVAVGVIVGCRHKLQGVFRALDEPLEAQVLGGIVGLHLFGGKDGIAVVQVNGHIAVIQDGAVGIIDAKVQKLGDIRRQEQILILHHRQGLFGGKAGVGHIHGDEVFLAALFHHRLDDIVVIGVAGQALFRQHDPQLHRGGQLGLGFLGGLALHQLLVDQQAFPRVAIAVFILRPVQDGAGGGGAAGLQLHGGLLRQVGVGVRPVKLGLFQRYGLNDLAAVIGQLQPEFVHQLQNINGGIAGHGGVQRRGGILQVAHAALEGDKAAGKRGGIYRQAAEQLIVQDGQGARSRRIGPGMIVAGHVYLIKPRKGKAIQPDGVGFAVLGGQKLQLGHVLAACGDVAKIPCAVQAGRCGNAVAGIADLQAQGVAGQGAVGVAHLHRKGKGAHGIFGFGNGDGRGGLPGKYGMGDIVPLLQRKGIAVAVLCRHRIGVFGIALQLGRGGGKGRPAGLLGLIQGAAAHHDGGALPARLGGHGKLQTVHVGQGVQLHIVKVEVLGIGNIAAGIGKGQVIKGNGVRLCRKLLGPVGKHGFYTARLNGGQLDLDQIGIVVFPHLYLDAVPFLFGIVAVLVLQVNGAARLQNRKRKLLRAGFAAAQQGGSALEAVAGVGGMAKAVGAGGAAALHAPENREIHAADNGAAGVIDRHIQAQRIAPRVNFP